jgi:hypothetical protein
MPGVRPLSRSLDRRDDVYLAPHGNYEEAARIKLGVLSISWRLLPLRCVGDDASGSQWLAAEGDGGHLGVRRTEVAPLKSWSSAIRRGRACAPAASGARDLAFGLRPAVTTWTPCAQPAQMSSCNEFLTDTLEATRGSLRIAEPSVRSQIPPGCESADSSPNLDLQSRDA